MEEKQEKKQSEGLGLFMAILGGLVAIGVAIAISGSVGPLWALILLAWGLVRVRQTPKPTPLGGVFGLMYVAWQS